MLKFYACLVDTKVSDRLKRKHQPLILSVTLALVLCTDHTSIWQLKISILMTRVLLLYKVSLTGLIATFRNIWNILDTPSFCLMLELLSNDDDDYYCGCLESDWKSWFSAFSWCVIWTPDSDSRGGWQSGRLVGGFRALHLPSVSLSFCISLYISI